MGQKKKQPEPVRIRLRRDDEVQVISGRDKGKKGRILSVDRARGRVLVEGINVVKKHMRANPAKQIKGGIAEREAPIHVSNVMIVTSGGVPTRMGSNVETVGGKPHRTRVARKGGETLDRRA